MRKSEITRKTTETDISLRLNIDGTGVFDIQTGIGFFDHMLTLFTRHGRFDLAVKCAGDLHVDGHHTVEDVGICLGRAIRESLGDGRGICRYADITLPMDEALILCAVDISGRGTLCMDVSLPGGSAGAFDAELLEEFLIAFAQNAGITIHLRKLCGKNTHHIIEGCFKALARTLRRAVSIDPALGDEIPSTKETLL